VGKWCKPVVSLSSGRLFLPAILVALILVIPTATTTAGFLGSTYSHPYPQGIEPGDIMIGHHPLSDLIIPGYWTHTALVVFYDPNMGDWVIVEATMEDGVRLSTVSDFLSRYDAVAVGRVETSNTVRQYAVYFALQQLGKPYDWGWWTKQVYGDAYYCSELVWASYKAAGGPDIDEHPGFYWKYLWGVAPQEIYDDDDVYIIYEDHS